MNTNGWDTVYATPVDTINSALAGSTARLLQEFTIDLGATRIAGTFGAWSIVPGGSGKLLLLQIDIQSGSFSNGSGVNVDLSGMSVVQQISLQLLPAPNAPELSQLKFDLSKTGADGAQEGFITPHEVKDPAGRLSAFQRSLVGQGVATALVQNASEVSFVLATINPAVLQGIEWMKPVKSSYCFQTPIGGTADLAILSVTSNRDISQLALQADPGLASTSGSAGLAISPQLFLVNLFGPALGHTLNTTFQVQPDGSIAASNVTLNIPIHAAAVGFKTPVVDRATARVSDALVIVDMTGHGEIGLGSSLTFSSHAEIGVRFDPASGRLETGFTSAPVFSHELHQNAVLSILSSIVPGANQLITSIQSITEKLIAQAIGRTTDLSGIGANAPLFVLWAGSSGFRPEEGRLENAFFVRGNLTPVVS